MTRILTSLFLFIHFFCFGQTVGLLNHSNQSLDDGYVLFAPMGRTETYLIDKCGKQVKTWNSTYAPGLAVYIMPDGNLLRTGNAGNPLFENGGQGGVIEIIDWNNNIVWSYTISDSLKCQHHDVKLLPNGNVLIIAWELKTKAEAIAQGRNPVLTTDTVWSEQILEIQPTGPTTGNIVWEWHLWDHLVQDFDNTKPNYDMVANNSQLVNLNYKASASEVDWIHFNSIDYNPVLDQILVSAHVVSEVWIIDHSTTTAEAASNTGGNSGKGGDLLYRWGNPAAYDKGTISDQQFFGQHNAHWIEQNLPFENQIMVFNNGFKRPGVKYSTVDIINPPTNGFNYNSSLPYLPLNSNTVYNDGNPNNFYASNTSSAQILSNKNLLMCNGPSGTFFEVDSVGNKVWEYINPAAITGIIPQNNPPNANPVFRCNYYPSSFDGFASHILVSGNIIENTNSQSATCILNTPLNIDESISANTLMVYPNPFNDRINTNFTEEGATYNLFNAIGQEVWAGTEIENKSFSYLTNGIYVLTIKVKSEIQTVKIIKE